MAKPAKKINESKDIKIGPVNFTFYVEVDPIRIRFMAKTSNDLDHLQREDDVEKVIKRIESKLAQTTAIKWMNDHGDPGAGYSFIPDESALKELIEASIVK